MGCGVPPVGHMKWRYWAFWRRLGLLARAKAIATDGRTRNRPLWDFENVGDKLSARKRRRHCAGGLAGPPPRQAQVSEVGRASVITE